MRATEEGVWVDNTCFEGELVAMYLAYISCSTWLLSWAGHVYVTILSP